MKERLEEIIRVAKDGLIRSGELDVPPDAPIQVERSRDSRHGDFSSNFAMAVAKSCGRKPREVAEATIARLPANDLIDRTEIAGPGFINFFLRREVFLGIIADILHEGPRYGTVKHDGRERIMVEFVSANPTGPLHIGHGRGAAYGAALANLLATAGHDVSREYYVNDCGRQMDILAVSIWFRYLEICGRNIAFPEQAYRGEYIRDIAAKLAHDAAHDLDLPPDGLLSDLPSDGDARMDELIMRCRKSLG
ncbi:MAG: arginine--tRNA ligase, partial [Gammaproteobacteria bacterium]